MVKEVKEVKEVQEVEERPGMFQAHLPGGKFQDGPPSPSPARILKRKREEVEGEYVTPTKIRHGAVSSQTLGLGLPTPDERRISMSPGVFPFPMVRNRLAYSHLLVLSFSLFSYFLIFLAFSSHDLSRSHSLMIYFYR